MKWFHKHNWKYLHTRVGVLSVRGLNQGFITEVYYRCADESCNDVKTEMIDGAWKVEDGKLWPDLGAVWPKND